MKAFQLFLTNANSAESAQNCQGNEKEDCGN